MTEQPPELKAFRQHFDRASQDKARVRHRLDDIYRLVFPHRHLQDGTAPQDSLDEIFDSTAIEAAADFASDMLNAFTPPFTSEWVKLSPARHLKLDAAALRAVDLAIADYKDALWEAIAASNLTQAARECYRDLATGTMAMLIQDVHPTQPIECTAIPVSDLYLERGPGGVVDGRFRKFRLRAELIPVMWPGAVLPETLKNLPADVEVDVTEGMWRDWKDRGTERWTFMLVEGEGSNVFLQANYVGAGACPMIVCRWDTDATTAWGFGPLYNALPDIKTINKLNELVLRNADRAVDPVVVYPDDGVIDITQGITAGTWIPAAQGSAKEVNVLDTTGNFNIGFMEQERLQSAIRRALFQDKPQQLGRTPPTATQWLDQAQETARRMGAPAGGIVTDWQFAIIRRFAFLLEKRGSLPKVELGNRGPISLVPTNPYARSQEQEKGVRLKALAAELAQLAGPQQAGLIIDWSVYAGERARQDGLEDTRSIRTPEQVQQMIQNAAAMAQQAGMLPGGQGQ
ncbi:portal protein [Azospirillum argentinense]